MSKTFILIKPDAIERGLVGEIITRIEKAGFNIKLIKSMQATERKLEAHYSHIVDKPFFNDLVEYMTRTKVICLVVEAPNAVARWRKIMGATNPDEADLGSIRGDLGIGFGEKMENLVHGSDSDSAADFEISLWLA